MRSRHTNNSRDFISIFIFPIVQGLRGESGKGWVQSAFKFASGCGYNNNSFESTICAASISRGSTILAGKRSVFSAISPCRRAAGWRRDRGGGSFRAPLAGASAEHNSWTAGWKVGLRAARCSCHRNLNGDISIRTWRRGVIRSSVRHKRATAPHPACPALRQWGTTTGSRSCASRWSWVLSEASKCSPTARASLISIAATTPRK